jgi:integrase/recombinase XerC
VSPASRLVQAFLAGRSAATLRSYRGDLRDFARWCGAASIEAAGELLLSAGPGGANEAALLYKAHLVGRGLAAATVNRRLAALRSLTRMGRTLGLIGWALEVEPLPAEAYRDTRGPGAEGVRRLLAQFAGRTDAKALRDTAVVRLLYDLGLRRKEVVSLDVADVDLAAGAVQVLGKGRQAKERVSLPPATAQALRAWLAARGAGAGPLFVALDRAHRGHRLTGQAVYGVVRGLGERAGLRARPHGLRHAAITRALDLTGGDVRSVQRFSRHRDVRVVQRYDDCRRDLAGEVARRLAGEG